MKYTESFCNAELRTTERGPRSVAVHKLIPLYQYRVNVELAGLRPTVERTTSTVAMQQCNYE